jgi:hypothetical protein
MVETPGIEIPPAARAGEKGTGNNKKPVYLYIETLTLTGRDVSAAAVI